MKNSKYYEDAMFVVDRLRTSKGGCCACEKEMMMDVLNEIFKTTELDIIISPWTVTQYMLTRKR